MKVMAIIHDRIVDSEGYVQAFEQAAQMAAERVMTWTSVEDARRAGGWSTVVKESIEAVIGEAETENLGSKLILMTIADVLKMNQFMVDRRARQLVSQMRKESVE